jgi:hypothetical protein
LFSERLTSILDTKVLGSSTSSRTNGDSHLITRSGERRQGTGANSVVVASKRLVPSRTRVGLRPIGRWASVYRQPVGATTYLRRVTGAGHVACCRVICGLRRDGSSAEALSAVLSTCDIVAVGTTEGGAGLSALIVTAVGTAVERAGSDSINVTVGVCPSSGKS